MRHGRRWVRSVLALALMGGALGGCVSQAEYDRLVEANRSLTNRNQELQASLDDCQSMSGDMTSRQLAADEAVRSLRDENERLRGLVGITDASLRDLESQLRSLQLGALDPETDRALRELAAANPDLIQYDPSRGMLRFASDLTFDSGSDAVKSEAKSSLARLADILKARAAAAYEVHVVGHTDSQPISSRTAERHPTNMHLSCHRAISVRRELVGMGVPAQKVNASGWGEFRPAVPNTASGNTPANRRVEIYLTRSTASASAAPAPTTTPAAPERQPDPTK
ncbi:MAG: OmpA family protein [Phycisphaerales bacterium]|nr:OmpA family protein [Phycisphaerales bacterium]